VSQVREGDGSAATPNRLTAPPTTDIEGQPPANPEPGAPPSWANSTFSALRIRPYRFLWLGGVFSFMAFQMQMIARGWLAFELTGSDAILGAVMFSFAVPSLFLMPWGGVSADRFGKRRIILIAQASLVLSGLLVAFAIVFDILTVTLLMLSAALQGAAMSFLGPARMAFTGQLVGRQLLSNAVVLQQMSMHVTRVFGPSLGGVLLAWQWFGAAGVFFLTSAFTFMASLMTIQLPPGTPSEDRVPEPPVREFLDGLRYVKRNPHLLLLLTVSIVVIMTAFPYVTFLPSLAEDVFEVGSEGFGLMAGVSGVGAVLASLLVAGRSGGTNAWKLQATAGMVFGIGLVTLRFTPEFWTVLVVMVFIGAANASFQAVNNTLVLMGSESAYHGRVQSLMMLSFSGFGLMALPLGIISDAIGLQNLLAGMGTVTIVVMSVYFAVRPVLERRHPTPVHLD
jgi:MFS family permease